MYKLSSVVRTFLSLTIVAIAICVSGGLAYGAGVQVQFPGFFNADDVLRYVNPTFTAPSISYDDSTPGGGVDNWMVTQSAANALVALQGGTASGINDNGFYPASGVRLYDVQLGFTNATPTGTNTVLRSNQNGAFTFTVQNNYYSQFAIFGSTGSGHTTLTITLNYATGSPTVLNNVVLPDWDSGNPGGTAAGAAGTIFALTPAMGRQYGPGSPNSGYQSPGAGGPYIFGVNLAPDSTRQLNNIAISYVPQTAGYTVVNFMTAAGAVAGAPVTTPAPSGVPALGTWGLVLLAAGLCLVCWLSLRRREA